MKRIIAVFSILLIVWQFSNAASVREEIDCWKQENCKNCSPVVIRNENGAESGFRNGCIKCSGFIVYESRQCVSDCPAGYFSQWSTFIDYMGKICLPENVSISIHVNQQKSKSNLNTILFIVLILLIVVTLLALHEFRRKSQQRNDELSRPLSLHNKHHQVKPIEFMQFSEQLGQLKPFAEFFLQLLNETRGKIREHFDSGDNVAIGAYRLIVYDLARLLFVINYRWTGSAGSIETREMPAVPQDWQRLYSWSQTILRNFKCLGANRKEAIQNCSDYNPDCFLMIKENSDSDLFESQKLSTEITTEL